MKFQNTLLIASATLIAVQVQAAQLTASASFDSYTIDSNGATITFSMVNDYNATATVNESTVFTNSKTYVGNTSGKEIKATWIGSNGKANATAKTGIQSSTSAYTENAGSAFAQTSAKIYYTIQGEGTVSVNFNISLLADLFETSNKNETANSNITIKDSLTQQIYNKYTEVFGGQDAYNYVTDTATFTFTNQNGKQGVLNLTANASYADTAVSPVPVPAAAWLFLSSLAGLVMARKK